jgi:hypothetical protein
MSLNPEKVIALAQLEQTIELSMANRNRTVEEAKAFRDIRDSYLYKSRPGHKFFGAYIKTRWKFSPGRMYQLIAFAEDLENLQKLGLDTSSLRERHTRELRKLYGVSISYYHEHAPEIIKAFGDKSSFAAFKSLVHSFLDKASSLNTPQTHFNQTKEASSPIPMGQCSSLIQKAAQRGRITPGGTTTKGGLLTRPRPSVRINQRGTYA